jgi:hypothetical protein
LIGDNLISFTIPVAAAGSYAYSLTNGNLKTACASFTVFNGGCQVSDANGNYKLQVN